MLENLDIRTLSLTLVLFCWLYGLGLFLTSMGQQRPTATRLWAIAIICEGCGFLLLGLRAYIPEIASVLIANLLLVIAMVLTQRGIESFRQSPPIHWLFHALPLLLMLWGFYHFTFISPNVNARIELISLLLSLLAFSCVWSLRNRGEETLSLARALTGLVFAGFGGFMLLRTFWTLSESSIPDFMQAGALHAFAFLVYLLMISGKSFGFIWMQNQLITNALSALARTDGLTGVLNRRTLLEGLQQELDRTERYTHALTLVMLDIDHFKSINDRYGHVAGDHALVELAKHLRRSLRKQDLIGRFGGEEFVLVLPDTDSDKAFEVIERVRSELERLQIGPQNHPFSITASFGIAEFGRHGNSADQLLQQADSAMYTAKAQGRNRTLLASHATATEG